MILLLHNMRFFFIRYILFQLKMYRMSHIQVEMCENVFIERGKSNITSKLQISLKDFWMFIL